MIGKILSWIGKWIMKLVDRSPVLVEDPEIEKEFENTKREHPPTSSSSQ